MNETRIRIGNYSLRRGRGPEYDNGKVWIVAVDGPREGEGGFFDESELAGLIEDYLDENL